MFKFVQNAVLDYVKARRYGSWFAYRAARKIISSYNNSEVEMSRNGEHWLVAAICSTGAVTAFDIGANFGEWSEFVILANPLATVYAFEPAPMTFQRLTGTVNSDNFFPFEMALSNVRGTKLIYYCQANPDLTSVNSWSHYDSNSPKIEEIQVKTEVGDEFCRQHQIEAIDFLKVDAEGHDYEIILGFRGMLEEGRIAHVQFEYNYCTMLGRHYLRDFFELLGKKYLIGRLLPVGIEVLAYHPLLEDFMQANFVAVLKDKLSDDHCRLLNLSYPEGIVGCLARKGFPERR